MITDPAPRSPTSAIRYWTGEEPADLQLSSSPSTPTGVPEGRMIGNTSAWRWLARLTHSYRQMVAFSRWFEKTLAPPLLEKGLASVVLTVAPDRAGLVIDEGPVPVRTDRVAALLVSLGIERIVADAKLEYNQLVDIFVFLWSHRRALARAAAAGRDGQPRNDLLNRKTQWLCSPPGVHLACTDTVLDLSTGELAITYSYCETRFSRGVRWFKLRNQFFRDHRTFFRAAPRYALYAVLAFMAPLLLGYVDASRWVIGVVGGLILAGLYVAVFVLFHALGSVEYDKEIQSERLQQALEQMADANALISGDLRRARQIQRGLVPQGPGFPLAEHCTVVVDFDPQMMVGGDYYDLKAVGPKQLGVIFGDVAGHGMGAAFVTGLLKTLFELEAEHFDRPAEAVAHINELLVRVLPSDSFAAVMYAILDFESRTMTYVNAGHHPSPWVLRPGPDGAGELRLLDDVHGLVCGVLPDEEYPEDTVPLESGMTIVMATDGWLDTQDPGGDRFERPRFEAALRRTAHEPVDRIRDALRHDLEAFAAGADAPDDRALVLVRIK